MSKEKNTSDSTNGSATAGSDNANEALEDTKANKTAPDDSSADSESGDRLPPLPADYEMRDDFGGSVVDDALDWAKRNPLLALAAVAGTGFLVGRVISSLIPEEEEPPTLRKRLAGRTQELRSDAGELGTVFGKRLVEAADALKEAADHATDRSHDLAEEGTEKARDFAELASDAARAAVSEVVSKKADSWAKKLRKRYGYKRFG